MVVQTFLVFFVHPIFWVVMLIVFSQYYRIAQMEERLFGYTINNMWEQGLKSLLLGIMGGFIASSIFVVMGLSLDQIGVYFILPVAILLLLFNPRFLCFAYAGGIVAAGVFASRFLLEVFPQLQDSQFFSSLADIYLPGMLVLIAVLHLIESLMIFIGGHWGHSPVYIKKETGQVVGGYSLQRFWPVPLVGIIAIMEHEAEQMVNGAVAMPEWWPILQSGIDPQAAGFLLLPVMAGLGYGDLALSSTPREKSLASARFLSVYSVVLLLLAVASEFYPVFIVPACIFAPLGHEVVVQLGNQLEVDKKPRYIPPDKGVMILKVYPGSPAEKAGLQEEDIILRVNGLLVESTSHFWQVINESYFLVHLNVLRGNEVVSLILKKEQEVKSQHIFEEERKPTRKSTRNQHPPLGIILVPDTQTSVYVEMKKPTSKILNYFRRPK